MVFGDIFAGIAYGVAEMGMNLAGADENAKRAVRAGIATTAAATGGYTMAIGVGATLLGDAGNAVADEAGMAPDNPFRQVISTGADSVGTITTAGMTTGVTVGNLVKEGAKVLTAAATATAEEAGAEGASALNMVSGLVGQPPEQAAISATGMVAGGAAAAGLRATDDDATDEQFFQSIGAGMSVGTTASGWTASAVRGSPSAITQGIDLGIRAAAVGVVFAGADANGEASVERSIQATNGLSVVGDLQRAEASGDAEAWADAALGAGRAAVEMARYVELEARADGLERAGHRADGYRADSERITNGMIDADRLMTALRTAIESFRERELESRARVL